MQPECYRRPRDEQRTKVGIVQENASQRTRKVPSTSTQLAQPGATSRLVTSLTQDFLCFHREEIIFKINGCNS
ncbi:uncharacterized protein LOC122577850 isoform X2 [Bombus pyrosoma]|uniref:uncharacterized protein LOC122577850 isoform X2 n=1 Tax=Bombus pyrosoma TaxID=396416 RepID=UPI001CB8E08F|nr:uncharacterized protein LOC122577850 isoform X2 [Bombus pyrosoma]